MVYIEMSWRNSMVSCFDSFCFTRFDWRSIPTVAPSNHQDSVEVAILVEGMVKSQLEANFAFSSYLAAGQFKGWI